MSLMAWGAGGGGVWSKKRCVLVGDRLTKLPSQYISLQLGSFVSLSPGTSFTKWHLVAASPHDASPLGKFRTGTCSCWLLS